MVTIQKYIRAQSLEEAYTLNQGKNNPIIGGGFGATHSSAISLPPSWWAMSLIET